MRSNIRKPLLIVGTVVGLGLAGFGVTSVAHAASASTATNDSLASRLASTFNLDKTKVQQVIDQEHSDRQAERDTQVSTKLDQLVKDGKLSEAQKSAILSKRSELEKQRQTDRSSRQNKTAEQRKADRQAKRTDLDNWAKQNNISSQYLRYVMGGGGHGMGKATDDTSTAD